MTLPSSFAAVAVLAFQGGLSLTWGLVPAEQISVLEELYRSTNGEKWKDNSGWLKDVSPCEWYGVHCDLDYVNGQKVSNVVSIDLMDNNLTGALPRSLATLPVLRGLNVALNDLGGDVPEELLSRWDRHAFEFYGAKNSFGNMVKRVRVAYSASGVLCSVDEDLRYVLDVQEYGPTRFESIRCVPNTERETRCLIKEGNGPYLERLSRALAMLDYSSVESEYWHPFTGATHQEFVTTTVWWGDGVEKTVRTYGRQGPIQVWSAQQLLLSLLNDVYWESERFETECSSFKED